MNKEQIQMSLEQQQQISSFLQNQGISTQDINGIFNGNYENYSNSNDLESSYGELKKHGDVLQVLSDGYSMSELTEQGISQSKVQEFQKMLEGKNLTVDNAKAIYQYSVGSNMILGVKRGTSVDTVQGQIMTDLEESLQGRGVQQADIEQIKQFVKTLDYQNVSLHDNYDKINQYMQQRGVPESSYVCARSAIQSMDRSVHINETIAQLEEGIGNTRLPKSMKLYRAVKSEYLQKGLKDGESLESLLGKKISNKGQTSTSPLYDSSFASLEEYDTVFEIYAPEGTRGSYIAELSAYDSTEQEVLLNPNDLYITGVQTGVIDKNGKTKNILQALCLSKDLECYKGITQSRTNNREENESRGVNNEQVQDEKLNDRLPSKQNTFSQFFSKLRARFMKTKLENTKSADEQDEIGKQVAKEGQNKPWDLSPEKKQEIQHGQAEIARKHLEMLENPNSNLEQVNQQQIEDEEMQL